MAYAPVNARSGWHDRLNGHGDGALASRRRFQLDFSASARPARNPTLGSGLGAVVDMLPIGTGAAADEDVAPPLAHPASETPAASAATRTREERRADWPGAMRDPVREGSGSVVRRRGAI